MAYLFDTDTYIYLLKGNQSIQEKIHEIGDENIFFSSISMAEIYFGIFNSQKKDKNLKKIERNLLKLQTLNFNSKVAKVFGRIKAELKKIGKPVADMDLAIASMAIYHQHILVTHNTKLFKNIQELTIEDWS